MECHCTISMGSKDHYQRLQTTVHLCPAQLRWCHKLAGLGGNQPCFTGGNSLGVKQGRGLYRPSLSVSERVLFQVFSGPQMEKGDWDSPYPGFTCSIQTSQEIQIQDAHTCISVTSRKTVLSFTSSIFVPARCVRERYNG